MNDIDTLSGIDLALAVARAQGYEVREWQAEGDWHIIERHESGIATFTPLPRPDQDLNMAWTLLPDYAVITKTPYDGTIQIKYELGNRVIATANHPATAICRAFLHDQEQTAQADDRYNERRDHWRQGDAL